MTKNTGISRRGLLAATGAALAAPGLALAQSRYPDRPIQLVIPWPAGGSADAQLRSIAELVGKALGQLVETEFTRADSVQGRQPALQDEI